MSTCQEGALFAHGALPGSTSPAAREGVLGAAVTRQGPRMRAAASATPDGASLHDLIARCAARSESLALTAISRRRPVGKSPDNHAFPMPPAPSNGVRRPIHGQMRRRARRAFHGTRQQ